MYKVNNKQKKEGNKNGNIMNIKQCFSNLKPLLNFTTMILLTIGLLSGLLINNFTAYFGNKDFKIEYISQMEILDLEKERVKEANASDLFFGRSDEAITLMEDLVKKRENKGARVVFSTEGIISGANVVSISEEIYSEVISKLEVLGEKVNEMTSSTKREQKLNPLIKKSLVKELTKQ